MLLVVFGSMWMLKTVHALSAHHQHLDRPVCEAALDHNAVHIHDERYSGEDCSLCAFVLAVPEFIACPALIASDLVLLHADQPLLYESHSVKATFDTVALRGPPAV